MRTKEEIEDELLPYTTDLVDKINQLQDEYIKTYIDKYCNSDDSDDSEYSKFFYGNMELKCFIMKNIFPYKKEF